MDTWLYNDSWTGLIFTPILFFKVNVVNNISLFYGVHTWHWYISQGIPFMMTTMSPLLVYGFYAIWNHPAIYHRAQSLLQLSVWIIVVYSLLPHKEFRFLFPIMPILLIMCAYGLSQLNSRWRKLAVWLLIGTQLPMALYTSLWHQRGVMDVMWWLRDQPVSSVGFLMPCHSTPWYSVLHKSTPMWFLTCEPPLDDRVDEADQFYQNPITYLEQHKKQTSHLVLFDNLYTQLNGYLKEQGFTECQRFFNSHFHDDTRRRGDVVVLCS
jgi:phosphatidylinositol glycan class B